MKNNLIRIPPEDIQDCPECHAHALAPYTFDPDDGPDDGTNFVCYEALGGCNRGFIAQAPVTSLIVKRGQKQFEFDEKGNFRGAHGPDGVKLYALIATKAALETEIRTDGQLKMMRGPHVSFRLKKQYGYTGNRHKVYRQFCEHHGLDMKQEILDKDPARTKRTAKAAARHE